MGLRNGDLRDLVSPVFEIDSYQSKMGEDSDIVVVSFSVEGKEPANDLMNFIEKGYDFVLDADVTPGEQTDGKYRVFVEIERRGRTPENILEIIDGVQKLADHDRMKFRYYKSFKSSDVSLSELQAKVPTDKESYESIVNESNINNYKNFFTNSYLENIDMLDNILYMKKAYADPIRFSVVDFTDVINNTITESFNTNSFPEILFLTKYLGDYNICKYGDKIVLENKDKLLILKRI
jgi:hypothetical protein